MNRRLNLQSPKIKANVRLRQRSSGHLAEMKESERQRVAAIDEYYEAAAPLMAELLSAGFEVELLEVLGQSEAYERAVPILVKWLPEISNLRVKESIIRVLSKRWAGSDAVAALLAEFRATPQIANAGLKWAIGNTLEALASDAIFGEIVDLVREKRHGVARQMLAVALGKMKNPQTVNVLIGLLDDDEVAGHALMALKKLKAKQARTSIERLLKHPRPWIRKQAMQALAKIES